MPGKTKREHRKPWGFIRKRPPAEVVSREEWGAVEPAGRTPLQLPVYRVLIKFYSDSPACTTKEECQEQMRRLQAKSLQEGLPDLPYNFCFGGDGRIYEGRGWFTVPSKTHGEFDKWDGLSVDFAYLGYRRVDMAMTPACADLLQNGITRKCIVGMFDFEVLTGVQPPPPGVPYDVGADDGEGDGIVVINP